MKDWIVETQVTSRRVYLVQAEDEKEAIFLSTQVPPETEDDEFEETIDVTENRDATLPTASDERGSSDQQAEECPVCKGEGNLGHPHVPGGECDACHATGRVPKQEAAGNGN